MVWLLEGTTSSGSSSSRRRRRSRREGVSYRQPWPLNAAPKILKTRGGGGGGGDRGGGGEGGVVHGVVRVVVVVVVVRGLPWIPGFLRVRRDVSGEACLGGEVHCWGS